MKLPDRVKVDKNSNEEKPTESDQKNVTPGNLNSNEKPKNSQDSASYKKMMEREFYWVLDHRDPNYKYSYKGKFFWRRNLSNEILIKVITNKIDPKSIKNVKKLIEGIKLSSKNMALESLLQHKLIRCHLSSCLKNMNLSINHYLRVKSNLTFEINIRGIEVEKWNELTKNMKYCDEELEFTRSLVKNTFGDLGLIGDWNRMICVYTISEKFQYFDMHQKYMFSLKLVQKEVGEVKFSENNFLDLRSNFSMLSRGEDLDNIEVDQSRRIRRSRLNSFSDSHSLKGGFRGLEQFNLF